MSNFIPKVFLRLLLLALKFKDVPAPTAIFKAFKVLNLYFNIQGLSRTFKVRANPGVFN